MLAYIRREQHRGTHTTKLVTFKVFGFATTETALVNQVGQFLCQHLFDHLDSLVESFLGRASNAEIQRRVLATVSRIGNSAFEILTAAVAMLLSG
jgi:hypothetical protein